MDLAEHLKEQAIRDLYAIGMGNQFPGSDLQIALMLDKKLLESEEFFNQFTFGELERLQAWIKTIKTV